MQPVPPPQQPAPYAVGDFAQYYTFGGQGIQSGYIRHIQDAVVNQEPQRWYKFVDNQNDLQNPEVIPHTIHYTLVERNQNGQFIWLAMQPMPVEQHQQGAAVGGRRHRSRRATRKSRRSGRKSHRSTRRR